MSDCEKCRGTGASVYIYSSGRGESGPCEYCEGTGTLCDRCGEPCDSDTLEICGMCPDCGSPMP